MKSPLRFLYNGLRVLLAASLIFSSVEMVGATALPKPAKPVFSADSFFTQAIPPALVNSIRPYQEHAAASARRWAFALAPTPGLQASALFAAFAILSQTTGDPNNFIVQAAPVGLFISSIKIRDAIVDQYHNLRFALHTGRQHRGKSTVRVAAWLPTIAVGVLASMGYLSAPMAVAATVWTNILIHVVPTAQHFATHREDALTGAWNRNFLQITDRKGAFTPDGHLPRLFQRASEDHTTLSAIMIDLDHFTRVNTIYGHAGGDHVLKTVVKTLQKTLRAGNELIRWGGEEFLILLPDTDERRALLTAERIQAVLANQSIPMPDGTQLTITGSIGVTSTIRDPEPQLYRYQKLMAWIKAADSAAYKAKQMGRNRVVQQRYDPSLVNVEQVNSRKAWLQRMKQFTTELQRSSSRYLAYFQRSQGEDQRMTFAFRGAILLVASTAVMSFVPISPLLAFISTLGSLEVIYRVWLHRALGAEILDNLTGARKADFLVNELPAIFKRSTSSELPAPLSVINVDFDNFKTVNDRFGHDAGDSALRAVAEAIRSKIRATDHFVRPGGDEFLIILPGTDAADAGTAAEKVLQAIRELNIDVGSTEPLKVTASLGVAQAMGPFTANSKEDMKAWLKQADDAAYMAKRNGRNQVVMASESEHLMPEEEVVSMVSFLGRFLDMNSSSSASFVPMRMKWIAEKLGPAAPVIEATLISIGMETAPGVTLQNYTPRLKYDPALVMLLGVAAVLLRYPDLHKGRSTSEVFKSFETAVESYNAATQRERLARPLISSGLLFSMVLSPDSSMADSFDYRELEKLTVSLIYLPEDIRTKAMALQLIQLSIHGDNDPFDYRMMEALALPLLDRTLQAESGAESYEAKRALVTVLRRLVEDKQTSVLNNLLERRSNQELERIKSWAENVVQEDAYLHFSPASMRFVNGTEMYGPKMQNPLDEILLNPYAHAVEAAALNAHARALVEVHIDGQEAERESYEAALLVPMNAEPMPLWNDLYEVIDSYKKNVDLEGGLRKSGLREIIRSLFSKFPSLFSRQSPRFRTVLQSA